MVDNPEPEPKRMRIAYHHRHKLQHGPQELPPCEPSIIQSTSLDKLLIDSIKTICEEEGLKQDIHDPIIQSLPLELLRNAAEEFIVQLCGKIRRSMLAARRTVPIAPDFETAFDVLDVARPDDQLKPYRADLRTNPSLLPTPPPEDPFHAYVELPGEFLGPELSKQDELRKFTFNTSSLPPLPSAHTYGFSEVFSERETDTRRIRELATEEGKLGEQALRKLAAAVKLETALSTEPDARLVRAKRGPSRMKAVLTEEALFEETMKDLLKNEKGGFELGPVVTSEKAYRMPDDARVKRRPATANKPSGQSGDADADTSAASKYNLLPPPLPKQTSSAVAASGDAMDLGFQF